MALIRRAGQVLPRISVQVGRESAAASCDRGQTRHDGGRGRHLCELERSHPGCKVASALLLEQRRAVRQGRLARSVVGLRDEDACAEGQLLQGRSNERAWGCPRDLRSGRRTLDDPRRLAPNDQGGGGCPEGVALESESGAPDRPQR